MAQGNDNRRPYALVVDDDEMVRSAAVDILDEAGFRTYEACDAEKAIAVLQEHHPSITFLFTDVEMPGDMDGFALARETSKSWPHIGILVASGRLQPGPGDLPEGAHFVCKPFSTKVVHNRMQQILSDDRRSKLFQN